jgi:exodeoxyribonuclease V alpha subunit
MLDEAKSVSRLDVVFARFLSERTRFDTLQKQAFEHIVMSVSYEQSQGHSCIQLDEKGRALVLESGLAISCSQSGELDQAATQP